MDRSSLLSKKKGRNEIPRIEYIDLIIHSLFCPSTFVTVLLQTDYPTSTAPRRGHLPVLAHKQILSSESSFFPSALLFFFLFSDLLSPPSNTTHFRCFGSPELSGFHPETNRHIVFQVPPFSCSLASSLPS